MIAHVCEWTWAEFISSDHGSQDGSSFTHTDVERMIFKNWNEPGNQLFYSSYDNPIALSRAVTDLDKMKEFYGDVMGGTVVQQTTYEEDGSEWLVMSLPNALTHVHFVKRPEKANSTFTVADFIKVHTDAHDKYIKGPLCGFDQWADDHWAYDFRGSTTSDSIVEKLDSYGYNYKIFSAGMDQVYAQDPTGWSIQLDGPYMNPPANVPTYSANCQINDSCTSQGYCTDEESMDLETMIKFKGVSFLN